jgi:hypothetical protein
MAFERRLDEAPPPPASEQLRVGAAQIVDGQSWTVASVTVARLIAAQGELPAPPVTDRGFIVADLRSTRDEVGTLDYGDPAQPTWSIGRSVSLADLRLTGLADAGEKTLSARGLACPSCGAALEIKLATTQSIVCHQCHAVVDVSQGVGAELAHYAQENGSEPLIPLGTIGRIAFGTAVGGALTALDWQVVGYVERCEVESTLDEDQVFWREYLLYHRTAGFTFLIDADDGWSWAAPITGVPQRFGDSVKHDGVLYRQLYSYTGKVTYVLGEFYWQLRRDERTHNIDYRGTGPASSRRLNREQTATDGVQEVVWSAGETLTADTVRSAFRLPADQAARFARDATPLAGTAGNLVRKVVAGLVLGILFLMLARCDSSDDCSDERSNFGEASQEYQRCLADRRSGSRTGGGSWGGFSSGGGGHK